MKVSVICLVVALYASAGVAHGSGEPVDLERLRELLEERRKVPPPEEDEQWRRAPKVGPSSQEVNEPDSDLPRERFLEEQDLEDREEQPLQDWQDEERSVPEAADKENDGLDEQIEETRGVEVNSEEPSSEVWQDDERSVPEEEPEDLLGDQYEEKTRGLDVNPEEEPQEEEWQDDQNLQEEERSVQEPVSKEEDPQQLYEEGKELKASPEEETLEQWKEEEKSVQDDDDQELNEELFGDQQDEPRGFDAEPEERYLEEFQEDARSLQEPAGEEDQPQEDAFENQYAETRELDGNPAEESLREWQEEEKSVGEPTEDEGAYADKEARALDVDKEGESLKDWQEEERSAQEPDNAYEQQKFQEEQRYVPETNPEDPESEEELQQVDDEQKRYAELESEWPEVSPPEVEERSLEQPGLDEPEEGSQPTDDGGYGQTVQEPASEEGTPKDVGTRGLTMARRETLKELRPKKVVSASRYDAYTLSNSGFTFYKISGVLVTVADGDKTTSQYFIRRIFKRSKWSWTRGYFATYIYKVKQLAKAWKLVQTKKITKSTFYDFLKATNFTRSSASAAYRMMKLE